MVGTERVHCYVKDSMTVTRVYYLICIIRYLIHQNFPYKADMTFRYCTLPHAYLGGVFLDDCFHLKWSVGCPLSYRNWNVHP